jgi:hypothetical protein
MKVQPNNLPYRVGKSSAEKLAGESFTKYDTAKPNWALVPWDAFQETVDILTEGAVKYAPNNWKLCEDPDRYFSALMRHLMEYRTTDILDKESGHHHLNHVICNCLFLIWMDQQKQESIDVV